MKYLEFLDDQNIALNVIFYPNCIKHPLRQRIRNSITTRERFEPVISHICIYIYKYFI